MRGNEPSGWLRPYQSFISVSSLFDQNNVIYSLNFVLENYTRAHDFRFNVCKAQVPSKPCCREMQVESDNLIIWF